MSFGADLPLILRFWLTMTALGIIGWPVVRKVMGDWDQGGYMMAKIVGLVGVTLGVWWAGLAGIKPLGWPVMLVAGAATAAAGWILKPKKGRIDWRKIIAEEVMFGVLLVGWAWVKGHEPTINGLEKFMDYGFTRSILRSDSFPPADMWYSGESINYYYFGHLMMAVLTAASGIDLSVTFNLMLAALFALCASMSFCIGRQLLRSVDGKLKLIGALLIAFLVTVAGNLQTVYVFTKGYQGEEDNPPPFWKILINPLDGEQRKLGREGYWYPNATRFIPYTIHEFPGYSFVVSDIHGHVLSIPLALFLIGLTVVCFGQEKKQLKVEDAGVYGVIAGAAFVTNALDGPIYLGLFALLTVLQNIKHSIIDIRSIVKAQIPNLKILLIVVVAFGLTVWPFVGSFKPFVNGVAVNCPPPGLAGKTFGPIIFEEVEKCQKSPLWMMALLWGLFGYGSWWLWHQKPHDSQARKLLLTWSVFCLGLIIFPEFFYFKDIYPAHFRSNTMFKLGYQVFMMMAILTGFTIIHGINNWRANRWWLLGVIPLLYLAAIYPTFSVKSYFGKLTAENYQGLYGLRWMDKRLPSDYEAVQWLNNNVEGQPVILEANGDSYTDYGRVSAFTGLPTVAGWTVHEWLWRGSYSPIAGRAEEVRQIYEGQSLEEVRLIVEKYHVEYIVLGDLERQKYQYLNEDILEGLGQVVFESGTIKIYRVT